MRKTIAVLTLLSVVALPTAAQFRDAVPPARPAASLYQASGLLGKVMDRVFNPSVFSMSHGIEMSTGSFGGQGYSMGMYTNTMQWQFSEKLAMRADVAVAYSPQNRVASALGIERNTPRVFLRNAEIDWRPNKRWHFNIQVRQDPYAYRNPYAFGPYGYGHRYGYARDPFWHDRWP